MSQELEVLGGADVRRAFEQWIQLTAIDTLGAAVASHLDEDDELFEGEPDDE